MLELVSIHIPKTAGSSFFRMLKQAYGRNGVLRLNTMNLPEDRLDEVLDELKSIALPRVIHGHVQLSLLDYIIGEYHPKIITWMREPVDRVISNYYFAMQRVREGKALARKAYTRDFSLLEYARIEENRNRASMLLAGTKVEDLFFIGFYETLEQDTRKLGELLGWTDFFQLPHQKSGSDFIENNDCKTQFQDITEDMRQEIAKLNELDVILYQQALDTRK